MQLERNGSLVSVPDFFIVGAAKAGTTSLYHYLGEHNNVFFPNLKEPGFFCHLNDDESIISAINEKATIIVDEKEYLSLFKEARSDQKICEATTDYLYFYNQTISNMKLFYGDLLKKVRIIILLRNPVDRAWSHYWMARRDHGESLSFEEAISDRVTNKRINNHEGIFYDYCGYGAYSKQVSAYLDAFGKESVRIFLLEDLISNASAICNEIFEFINVEKVNVETTTVYNAGGGSLHLYLLHDILFRKQYFIKGTLRKIFPESFLTKVKYKVLSLNSRKEIMPPETRHILKEKFRYDIKNLSALIGRDLSMWLS